MARIYTADPGAADTPVDRWQRHWRSQVDAAAQTGDARRVQRFNSFGSWGVVVLDTILLFVTQLLFSVPVIIGAILLFVANGHHLSSDTANIQALQDWLGTPQALAASALATQLAIVALLQVRVVGRGLMTWSDLGFGPALRREPLHALALGIGLGLVAFVVGEVLLYILHALGLNVSGQEDTLKSVKHAGLWAFIPFAITAAVTAPLAEETFFRAYALRALTVRYGLPIGLVVSSAIFAALHLTGGVGWVAVALFAVGAVLAWGYAHTGNLITNVSAHALNNAIGLILLYKK